MNNFEFRPRLNGETIFLRLLEPADAPEVLALYSRNRDFLKPWEPSRPDNFYTLETIQGILKAVFEAAQMDRTYSFGIFLKTTGEMIGRINLNNVVRGVFHNADLGYFLDQAYNGQGYTSAAVRLVVRFAFREIGLHRVAAGTLLHNEASMRVLEKAGFRREGLARRYLKIDDQWQDHYLFGITAEEFTG